MEKLVVTGAAGALGRRVLSHWVEHSDGGFSSVLAIDRDSGSQPFQSGSNLRHIVTDLSSGDVASLFEGADVVVHLAAVTVETSGSAEASAAAEMAIVHRVLDAAAAVGVKHVVLLSSATVYGAWADNPVPLTEDAPLRPNPGFTFAASRAELEQVAGHWRDEHPGTTVALLRPAVCPSVTGVSGWLFRAVRPGIGDRVIQALPAMQFLHLDDLASAVLHSASQHLDGPYNVAPDSWIRGEDAPALLGTTVSVPLPGKVGDRVVSFGVHVRDFFEGRNRREGAVAWTRSPWVVANDRLRATGWTPHSTSEETVVASRKPSRFATLFARRRQEVTLAAVALLGLLGVLAITALVRRFRRAS